MSINDLLDDPDILPMFMTFFGLAIIIIVSIAWVIVTKAFKENNIRLYGADTMGIHDTEISVMATVIEKRTAPNPIAPNTSVSYLLFEQEDGTRKEFAIKDQNTFSRIIVGDTGILKYYSNHFVSFAIQK